MSVPNNTLSLTLGNGPHKVSALSSLFRSLQAAVRETATGGVSVESMFSVQDGPFLVAQIENTASDALKMSLWFANRYNEPLEQVSEEVFERTLNELGKCVVRGAQHTFWGSPAGVVNAQEEDERIGRFISNLRTIGSAAVSFKTRRIKLENEVFSIQEA